MYHDIIQWSATTLQFESICFSFQKVSIQRQFSSLKSIQRRFLKTVHHLRRFESTTKLIEERSVGLACFFIGNGKVERFDMSVARTGHHGEGNGRGFVGNGKRKDGDGNIRHFHAIANDLE